MTQLRRVAFLVGAALLAIASSAAGQSAPSSAAAGGGAKTAADTTSAPAEQRPCHVFMVIHREGAIADSGFMDYLQDNGFNCRFTIRDINNDRAQLPAIVEEIKRTRPDLVYTQTTVITVTIAGPYDDPDPEKYVTDIPIVFALVSDPVEAGLVAPGESEDAPLLSHRNLTGARHVVSHEVRLKAMLSYMPIKTLGVVYDETAEAQRSMIKEMEKLAAKYGIRLVKATAVNDQGKRDPDQIRPMVERIAAEKPDLLYIPPSNFFAQYADLLTGAALDLGLPTFCGIETYIRAKCLAGLVAPFYGVGRLAGYKAEQILTGERRAGDIPIQTLSRFSFVVNMATAHALGAYPPMKILRYANVINSDNADGRNAASD